MAETYVLLHPNHRLDHDYGLRLIGPVTDEQAAEITNAYEPWETEWRGPETFEKWTQDQRDDDDDND